MDSMTMMSFNDLDEHSMDLIKNVPWAQDMYEYLNKGLQKGFLAWCNYVIGLSRNEATINKWVDEYKNEYERYTCELVANISYVNSKVLNQVEKLLSDLQKLCTELRIEMPYVGNQKLCLYEELKQLKKRIEELEQMQRVRKDELTRIYAKQNEICTSLGKTPKIFPNFPMPSVEEIEELQKHIEAMESEKYEREEIFLQTKCDILKLIDELNVKPMSDFENKVLFEDDVKFMVTDLNMKELDKFYKKLVKNKEDMIEEINEKWAKLDRLWTVLEVDVAERSQFSDANPGHTKQVLKNLNEEMKRLEQIKKENIKVFIEKYRAELMDLWDKCHCGYDSRHFQYFNVDCYTEDYLELFDLEIQKWKKYYEENKTILKLLDEYNQVVKKLAELEEAAAGPNRFQNRGGKLLLEEKERNKHKRRIPQIKENLISMSEKYKELNGVEFMTWGKTVEDFIENLDTEIQNEKKQKLSVRKQQRDQLTPAKSRSRLFSAAKSTSQLFNTPSVLKLARKTPETSNKRKIQMTPRTDVKRKAKVDLRAPTSEYKKRPKVVSSRLSSDRKLKSQRRLSRSKKENNMSNRSQAETSGYDKFETELSKKHSSRSTLHFEPENFPSTPVSRLAKKLPFTPTNVPLIIVQSDTPSMGTPKNKNFHKVKALGCPGAPKSPRVVSALSAAKNNNNMHF